jgi:nitrogen fixation NifU-like protein
LSLDDLYQRLILDHYRRPRNRGPLEGADRSVERVNPLCGDAITVDVRIAGGRLEDCRFHGQGCSISQASASLMTERVKGRTLAEAREVARLFRALLRGAEEEPAARAALGDLAALGGVVEFPVRVQCAMLAWNALEAALAEEGTPGAERAQP